MAGNERDEKYGMVKKKGNSQNSSFLKEGNSQKQSLNKKSPSPPIFSKKSQIFSRFSQLSQFYFLRIILKIVLSAARGVLEIIFSKNLLKFLIFVRIFLQKSQFWGFSLVLIFRSSSPKLSKMKMWQFCSHHSPNNLKIRVPESSF